MPGAIPTKGFDSQIKLACTRMEDAFRDAIREYTKQDKIEFAKLVQKELDEFKSQTPVLRSRTLSQILQKDVTVGGNYRFPKFHTDGIWSLTITERVGNNFTAKYFAQKTGTKTDGTADAKGIVKGNEVIFEVDGLATISGILKNNELRLDYKGKLGNEAILIAPDVK